MADLQLLQSKAVCIIFPLSMCICKLLSRKVIGNHYCVRRAEHGVIFTFKSIDNLFSHTSQYSFNRDFHCYSTRSRNNLTKTAAKRRWGHINCATEWNSPDLSLRDADSLSSFKRSLSEATIKVPLE